MEVSDPIALSDLILRITTNRDLSSDTKSLLVEIVTRVDQAVQMLVLQLKKEPTIYIVDPVASPNDVIGAKSGDVAIFVRYGEVHVQQFS